MYMYEWMDGKNWNECLTSIHTRVNLQLKIDYTFKSNIYSYLFTNIILLYISIFIYFIIVKLYDNGFQFILNIYFIDI